MLYANVRKSAAAKKLRNNLEDTDRHFLQSANV